MLISTTQDVPGREVTEILGLARGNSVRARHAGRDIVAALRNLVGGEITEYALLQAETREVATRRMTEQAESFGADAVIGVRSISLSEIQPSLPTLTGIRQEYLKGITGEREVILDAEKLLSDKNIVVHQEV